MIQCKHCPKRTGSSVDVARVEGWRMFSGVSQTGKQIEDVVCPRCAGTLPEDAREPGWNVRCRTCDWQYDEDDEMDDEGPLTVKDAKLLARNHECDPDVEIAAPDSDRWVAPWMVNDDGAVRDLAGEVAAAAVGGRA